MDSASVYDIFVSYERDHDGPIVRDIVAALQAVDTDLRVFIDDREIDPGEYFDDRILKELGRCRMVLGAVSSESVKSRHVAAECRIGHDRDILLPILVGEIPKKDDWHEGWFEKPNRSHWIDLTQFALFDPKFIELLERIGSKDRLDRPSMRFAAEALTRRASAKSGVGDIAHWTNVIRATDSREALEIFGKAFPRGPLCKLIDERRAALDRHDRTSLRWPDGTLYGASIDIAASPGTVFRDDPGLPEMVVMPKGRFRFGPLADERGTVADLEGETQREIHVQHNFAVAKHLLTFAEWDFALANGLTDVEGKAYRPDSLGLDRALFPAFHLSWADATAYCAWASRHTGRTYRLLSEAEWEYCCRAGNQDRRFHFGDTLSASQANFGRSKELADGVPVSPTGKYPPNAFDLCDMHGNLWEWVQDPWRRGNDDIPVSGGPRTSGSKSNRVVRGGSWSNDMVFLRSAARSFRNLSDRTRPFIGIRTARNV